MTGYLILPPDRCQITTRFVVGDEPVVVECRSEAGYPGDYTTIDAATNRAIQVGRSASSGEPMKRWMIDWDPPQVIRQPLVFGDRATADAACALIIARLPKGGCPRPIVVELLAGVLDNLQPHQT